MRKGVVILYTIKRKNGHNQNLTTLEQHFNYILNWFNFDFYNVDETFCIQLFEKDYFSNDDVDCIAEFQSKSISNVVSQAIDWIDDEQNS